MFLLIEIIDNPIKNITITNQKIWKNPATTVR